MSANTSTRDPIPANQTGVNQATAGALATLLGSGLLKWGVPPEAAPAATAVAMGVVTTLGTVLRNIFNAKGWTKYIG